MCFTTFYSSSTHIHYDIMPMNCYCHCHGLVSPPSMILNFGSTANMLLLQLNVRPCTTLLYDHNSILSSSLHCITCSFSTAM